MKFSQRLQWQSPPNRLSQVVAEKRAAGSPVLDITESNPTRARLSYPPDLLAPLASAGGLHTIPRRKG
ncbi:MAG: hypothetical protein WDO18_17885 [Acidobacteriota bacterium]